MTIEHRLNTLEAQLRRSLVKKGMSEAQINVELRHMLKGSRRGQRAEHNAATPQMSIEAKQALDLKMGLQTRDIKAVSATDCRLTFGGSYTLTSAIAPHPAVRYQTQGTQTHGTDARLIALRRAMGMSDDGTRVLETNVGSTRSTPYRLEFGVRA